MTTLDAVLFDLDGTLLDTAPDFFVVVNQLCEQHSQAPISYEAIRATVSHGARALVTLAFNIEPDDAHFEQRRQELLALYSNHLAVKTCLFNGLDELLTWLESQSIGWGIVTNKPARFTGPVLEGLNLNQRVGPVICPDHVKQRKPDPEGLLIAAHDDNVSPANCLYVGDHLRDIQAGQNAGMETAVAAFGYIDADDDPRGWQANYYLEQGSELLPLLQKLYEQKAH